jgi:hypothetical protein
VHTQTDTKTPHRARHKNSAGMGAVKTQNPPIWRPQQVGLSRDELRRIVIDQLG